MFFRILFITIFFLFLIGCDNDYTETDIFHSPVIIAEAVDITGSPITEQNLVPGDVVTLTAEGSFDHELFGGTENLSYHWVQLSGEPCFLEGGENDMARDFTIPNPTTDYNLSFQIEISNGKTTSWKILNLTIEETLNIIPPEINNFEGETSIITNFTQTTGKIYFTVSCDPSTTLTITANSSNESLVPNDGNHIFIEGDGETRSIEIFVEILITASTEITVTVEDGYGQTDSETHIINAIVF